MKTVDQDYINIIEIKKSKFISIICYVENIDDINNKIAYYKEKYPKAKHYCYAYKINSMQKYNDDKEPSGTAGLPILNNILKNNLDNVLVLVIRYFGGIKLGSGPLTRAYSNSAKEVIEKAHLLELKEGYKLTIEASYNDLKELDYLLKDKIVKKNFKDKITLEFNILKDELNKFKKYKIIKKEATLIKM